MGFSATYIDTSIFQCGLFAINEVSDSEIGQEKYFEIVKESFPAKKTIEGNILIGQNRFKTIQGWKSNVYFTAVPIKNNGYYNTLFISTFSPKDLKNIELLELLEKVNYNEAIKLE